MSVIDCHAVEGRGRDGLGPCTQRATHEAHVPRAGAQRQPGNRRQWVPVCDDHADLAIKAGDRVRPLGVRAAA